MKKCANQIVLYIISSVIGTYVGSALSILVSSLYYPEEKIRWQQFASDSWESFMLSPLGMILAPFGPPGYNLCEEYGFVSGILASFGILIVLLFTILFFIRAKITYLFPVCLGFILWNHINHQNIVAIIYR